MFRDVIHSVVLASLLSLPMPSQEAPQPEHGIPDGAKFVIRLDDKLDTRKMHSGKRFKAKLSEDLLGPDGSIIARGSKIKGHVSAVDNGFHARMLLSFDEIETRHGWVPLFATVTDVPGEHGLKPPDDEGELEREGTNKRHEIEGAGVGAGVGAGTGAIAGGGKGAAIGAGIGAAAGALSSLFTDRSLVLQKGTMLELRLDRPLHIYSR
jgi:hypothetical protein